jgi:hypothetical protein
MKHPHIIGISPRPYPYRAVIIRAKRGRRGSMPSGYARLRKRSRR